MSIPSNGTSETNTIIPLTKPTTQHALFLFLWTAAAAVQIYFSPIRGGWVLRIYGQPFQGAFVRYFANSRAVDT